MSRKNRERRIQNRRTKEMSIDKQADVALSTPAATWRVRGEEDPHGTSYDCERAQLTLGDLTDDELANGNFMNYDAEPPIEDIIAQKPGVYRRIVWATAVKDRIRWLSRALLKTQEQLRLVVRDQIRFEIDPDDPRPDLTIEAYVKEFVQAKQKHDPTRYVVLPIKHDGRAGLTDTMMRAFYEAYNANEHRGDFERLNAGYSALIESAQTEINTPLA
jgi:hypothetical protein